MPGRSGSIKKYAQLLVHYSLNLKEGEKILIQTTTLAEELVAAIYEECLKIGAFVEIQFEFEGKEELFWKFANEKTVQYVSLLTRDAFQHFDAFLSIRAPFEVHKKSKKSEQ